MKHLGNVLICGAGYPVIEGNAGDEETLANASGVCKVEDREIWLQEGLPASKAVGTLVHEVLHAINADSGLIYALAAALGINEADPRLDAAEEMLVRILTPHIFGAFGPPVMGTPKKGRKRGKRS
jgi:hypothetical protein